MVRAGIDLLYLAPGANAQYLSGWRRNRPHFGNVNYPGGWVQGLLLGLEHGPLLAVPRMVAEFDLEPNNELEVRVEQRLASEVVAPLRMVKEAEELTAVQAAADIVDRTMTTHRALAATRLGADRTRRGR